MKPLTPTQKATSTGTYFIRSQVWLPDGSKMEVELPWVGEQAGKEYIDILMRMANTPELHSKAEQIASKVVESKKERRVLAKMFPIVSDSDWIQQSSSRPMRGIYDSARTIVFERVLTDKEFKQIKVYLAKEAYRRGIGWTGVGGQQKENNTYRFTTTWDSSD